MEYTICRLCLDTCGDQMWKLTDGCDILRKIRSLLSFNLAINDVLPNQVCSKCVNKIEEIYEFFTAVKKNDRKLQEQLENNTLLEYFITLGIKEERNKSIVKIKQENLKLTQELDTEVKENLKNEGDSIDIKDEQIMTEINTILSSDDEDNVALSSLKNDRLNTINVGNEPEKLNFLDYTCMMCDKVIESFIQLRDHYKAEHTSNSSENIKSMYTETLLNGKLQCKCDKCDKICSKKYIKRHILLSHMNERPYICKLCGRTYKTVSDIMRHGFRAHGGHKLYCSYKCGFSTAYSGALKAHEDKIHKNVYKYTCDKCNKGFSVKTWYEQHQNVHSGDKPFVCHVCGAAFHMDKYLTSHRTAMHPQSLSKKCLVCLQCNLKCDSVNSLTLHLETEHGIVRSKTRKKKTLCDFCGKILNRPEQLVFHRRMHLGEKPYKCSECGAMFVRKYSLAVHARAHVVGGEAGEASEAGEAGRGARARGPACARCGRAYSQPSALYRHQRLHHGIHREKKEKSTNI